MKQVTLKCVRDRETGELGLMAKGTPIIEYPMVATEGRLVAHDLIEHVNGVENIGSIGDELEALGACWFVRGQWADISRPMGMYSAEENLASDVARLGELYLQGIPLRVVLKNTRACEWDDVFTTIIGRARQELRDEHEEPIAQARVGEYCDACLHLLRTGYRKARRRYQSGAAANSMFWNIAEAVDPYCKYPSYEGQEFLLYYDRHTANVEEVYI